MNYVSKIFAFLVAVLLLFIVPAYRISWITDQAVHKQVNFHTCEFVNTVRHKGFVSKEIYEEFIRGLSETGNVYDIEMKHSKDVWDYVVVDAEKEEVETMNYFDEYPTGYILDGIYNKSENKYFMSKGDCFSVTVINKSKTGAMIFMNLLGGGANPSIIFSKYGGMIINEDY